MNNNISDAQKLLEARIDDSLRQSDRGELVCGNFLTPADRAYAEIVLRARRASDRAFFFGGYSGAERTRIFFIPSYLTDLDGSAEEKARTYCNEEFSSSICSIIIKGSGYRNLSHRDYLGSILSLGIERREIGDIVVTGEYEAIVFSTDRICNYLITNLEKIATDKVKVKIFDLPEDFKVQKNTVRINDTVASQRHNTYMNMLHNKCHAKES